MQNPQFLEFVALVEKQVQQHLPDPSHRLAALAAERKELETRCQGWIQTLGKPDLSPAIRSGIESQYEQAQARIAEISAECSRLAAQSEQAQAAVDPAEVAERLAQLAEILAGENPSAGNLMLSQHIEGIYCDENGQVVARTCKLGALAGALELVPRHVEVAPPPEDRHDDSLYKAQPRRRTRRNSGDAIDDEAAAAANDFAVDPGRFGGLGPEWFTADVFQVPRRLSWAEEYAREVAEYRLEQHASMEVTSKHFDKTVPTIRAALRYAKELYGIDAFGKAVSRPTLPNWSKANAAAVAEYIRKTGSSIKAAAKHFGKSEPTIGKALKFAEEGLPESSTNSEPPAA